MKSTTDKKTVQRARRHTRVRAKVIGSAERPRLCIFKSNTRIIAQIIDDGNGVTIAASTSDKAEGKSPRARVEDAARIIAGIALKKGVSKVVFDRGGFQYVGHVKAFADSARVAGLQF